MSSELLHHELPAPCGAMALDLHSHASLFKQLQTALCMYQSGKPCSGVVLQVTDLIAMTLQVHKVLPRDARGQLAVDQYTMPANFRRRLKSLQHAPPICYSLPLDPTRRYEASHT